jgi:PAS domain S-box-containing protein
MTRRHQRKRTEERLREYEKAVEHLEEMIVVVDRSYRYLIANRAFLKYRGLKRKQLIGRSVADLLNPSVFEGVAKKKLDEALRGKTVKYELKYTYANRGERDLFISYFPVKGRKQVDRVVCVLRDITERKQAEERLRLTEARFRRYFELGLIGMALSSPSKGILEVNDELCRILGYSCQQLLTKTWAQLTHPDDRAADEKQFQRVLEGEINGYSLEKRWIRKDRQVVHTIMAANCQRRLDGSIEYFVGLVQDITARKRSEDEHRKLAALVQNSRDFVGLASLDGDVIFVNEAGRNLVGLDGQGSTTIFDYLMKEDHAFVAEHLLPTVANVGEWEGDLPMRHFVSGAAISMHVKAFLIKEEGTGRPLALATISRDITERQRAEKALQQAQGELAHATRVMTFSELAASIAHEINQPLGAIVNNSNFCLQNLNGPGTNLQKRAALNDIVFEANRASHIIKRVRAFTRKSPAERTSVNVGDVIADVLLLAQRDLSDRAIQVESKLSDKLPPIWADRIQVQQVLLNFVRNGIDAMESVARHKRGIVLGAKGHQLDEKPAVVISVRDSGRGLNPAQMSRLFQAFHTTKAKGMGMGLRIARSIVEAHGGKVWAKRNAGKAGATFYSAWPTVLVVIHD